MSRNVPRILSLISFGSLVLFPSISIPRKDFLEPGVRILVLERFNVNPSTFSIPCTRLMIISASLRSNLFDLVDIQDAFAQILGKTVDVGTPEGLSKYIRDRVLAEAETVYEK